MELRSSVVRWAVIGLGALTAVGGSACGPAGSWEPESSLATQGQSLIATTGSMANARAGHVAVLLQDGSVLVAGGWTATGSLSSMTASAERYVPAAGTWSSTGSMLVARERHVAVRLQNGQVLVAAGLGLGTTYLSSAELYEPATGTWSATGSLSIGRTYPTLSLLQDGRALLVGGSGSGVGTSVEVYNPATGTWSATGSLLTARSNHTATVLPSGKVLVVGGGGPLASAELYEPTTGTWSSAGSLTYARTSHSAHLLPDGRVLLFGGYGSSSSPLMSEIYNPSTGTWTNAGQFNVAHYQGAGVSLADGSVLVAGGSTGTVEPRIERYNLATGAWSLVDNLITPRSLETGTLLGNGQVLLVGGSYGGALASAELYTDVVSSDTTPPTTQLTSPSDGATVSGSITLGANASDNVGVARVEFYRGSTLLGSDTTAPYSLSWNSASVANGVYVLTSKAHDAAGNVATSASVSITVSNTSTGTALFAAYDSVLKAPRCSSVGLSCDTGTLVNGRANLGAEPNQPNTLQGSACADGASGGYHSDESLDGLKVSTLDGTAFAPGKTVKIEAKVWAWSGGADLLDLYYTVDVNNPSWVYITTVTAAVSGAQTLSATYTLPTGTVQAVRGAFRYGGSASACTTGGYDDRDDLVFAAGN